MTHAHIVPVHPQPVLPTLPSGLTILLTSGLHQEAERDLVQTVVSGYEAAPEHIYVLVAEPFTPPRRPATAVGSATSPTGLSAASPGASHYSPDCGSDGTRSSSSEPTDITGRYFEAHSGLAHLAKLPGRNLVVWNEVAWKLGSSDYARAAAILKPLIIPGVARGLMYSIRSSPDAHLPYQQFQPM